jgi:hypothetical protein
VARAGRPRAGLAAAGLAGALALAAVSGCSSGPAAGAAGTSCGKTRTAVNVPVVIEVARGTVSCATAVAVEHGYAAAVSDGDLRGNGGGAPVAVDGWTCQTYPTPQVLRTGDASECHTASAEVVEVLALPSTPAPDLPGTRAAPGRARPAVPRAVIRSAGSSRSPG